MSIDRYSYYDSPYSFLTSGTELDESDTGQRELTRMNDVNREDVAHVDITGDSNKDSDFTFNYDYGSTNNLAGNNYTTNYFDPYSIARGFDASTGPSYTDSDSNSLLTDIINRSNNTASTSSTEIAPGVPIPGNKLSDWLSSQKVLDYAKSIGTTARDLFNTFLNNRLVYAGLGALAGYLDRAPPSGGGYTKRVIGATPMKKTTVQGPRGPIVKYAADGGLMNVPSYQQARMIRPVMMNTPNGPVARYVAGGPVRMEDGGFVMTKKAVDGAGGPSGIRSLIPGAQMIRGPGTGTSDSIPAVIEGNGQRQPAALSNGEAYVPKREVQAQGGPDQMYALMHNLQRRG